MSSPPTGGPQAIGAIYTKIRQLRADEGKLRGNDTLSDGMIEKFTTLTGALIEELQRKAKAIEALGQLREASWLIVVRRMVSENEEDGSESESESDGREREEGIESENEGDEGKDDEEKANENVATPDTTPTASDTEPAAEEEDGGDDRVSSEMCIGRHLQRIEGILLGVSEEKAEPKESGRVGWAVMGMVLAGWAWTVYRTG